MHFIMPSSFLCDSHVWGSVSCRRVLAGQVPMSAALVSASLTGIGGNPNSYQRTHCFGLIKYQCAIKSATSQIAYQGHLRTCIKDLLPKEFRSPKGIKQKQDREISVGCERIRQRVKLGMKKKLAGYKAKIPVGQGMQISFDHRYS